MKPLKMLPAAFFAVMLAASCSMAGEMDVLVSKLVEKGVLSPAEARTIVDQARVEVAKEIAQGKSAASPEWAQRVKMSGDVRFRTQGDWGKENVTQPNDPAQLQEQRLRQRIRGRFAIEGKVNDIVYAGTRFAGGNTDPRSTNDTLTDYFSKAFVMFDQYYIRFETPQDLVRRTGGAYFSDMKLWLGKMPIPFEYSELVWDSDINPGGMAFQYAGPDIRIKRLPDITPYANIGMFWLDEMSAINTDPLLFGYQAGIKTSRFGWFDSTLNICASFYNFANLQNKTPDVSALTNSRVVRGDLNGPYTPVGSTLPGTYKYEYNVFDLLVQVDNNTVCEYEAPHGFYADFIYNASCHEPDTNKGCLLGAYLGKKKLKEPKDCKVRAEWRYIGRDAIPDFMPDSDFYGFGTYTGAAAPSGVNGVPRGGGTNGKGVNMAFEYQLFKNTTLNCEYYWMKPIKSWDKRDPWNELQIDVVTKF